jgi:hypothetical protein
MRVWNPIDFQGHRSKVNITDIRRKITHSILRWFRYILFIGFSNWLKQCLMLPVLGSSTLRDVTGKVADGAQRVKRTKAL